MATLRCWLGLTVPLVSPALIEHSRRRRVSLENRIADRITALANQQRSTVRDEDRQNEELRRLSREILELTKALHQSGIPAERDDSP